MPRVRGSDAWERRFLARCVQPAALQAASSHSPGMLSSAKTLTVESSTSVDYRQCVELGPRVEIFLRAPLLRPDDPLVGKGGIVTRTTVTLLPTEEDEIRTSLASYNQKLR